MATVTSTELDPAGTPHVGARVTVRLMTALYDADVAGYVVAEGSALLGQWRTRTDEDGTWSIDVESNEDIEPANTVYVATVEPRRGSKVRHTFSVPAGAGPFDLVDIRTVSPTDLLAGLSGGIDGGGPGADYSPVSFDGGSP